MNRLSGEARRWCCAAVVLALLFQAWLPLIHQPQVSAGTSDIPAWILSSLCRGGASTDASAIPADDSDQQPASPKMPTCPICLAAQIAGLLFAPPIVAGLPLPIQGEASRFRAVTASPRTAARIHRPQARAPPLPV